MNKISIELQSELRAIDARLQKVIFFNQGKGRYTIQIRWRGMECILKWNEIKSTEHLKMLKKEIEFYSKMQDREIIYLPKILYIADNYVILEKLSGSSLRKTLIIENADKRDNIKKILDGIKNSIQWMYSENELFNCVTNKISPIEELRYYVFKMLGSGPMHTRNNFFMTLILKVLAVLLVGNIEKLISPCLYSRLMIHGDLHLNNFYFTKEGRVCILDWENTKIGSRYLELSYLYAQVNYLLLDNNADKVYWKSVMYNSVQNLNMSTQIFEYYTELFCNIIECNPRYGYKVKKKQFVKKQLNLIKFIMKKYFRRESVYMDDRKKRYWNIAGIIIGVCGKKEMVAQFGQQFLGCELETKPVNVDLKIEVVSSIDEGKFQPTVFSLAESIKFNDNTFSKKMGQFTYIIKNLFEHNLPTEVIIVDSGTIDVMRGLNRIRYGKSEEYWKCESYMNYGFFWMIFAVVLQKNNKLFIHSSIAEINGNAIVLSGTSGCGKTSTLFKLFEKKEVSYLAEDFGVIDENGVAYFNPKKISIYASDVRYGQHDLVAYRKKMSGRDDIMWRMDCALKRNPRRKVNPKVLLGQQRVKKSADVNLIVFLVREERDNTICEHIDKEDLIYRITEASYRELKELYELLSNIQALKGKNCAYPTIEDLKQEHSAILCKALANSRGCLCRVSRKGTPNDILAAIRKWDKLSNSARNCNK